MTTPALCQPKNSNGIWPNHDWSVAKPVHCVRCGCPLNLCCEKWPGEREMFCGKPIGHAGVHVAYFNGQAIATWYGTAQIEACGAVMPVPEKEKKP